MEESDKIDNQGWTGRGTSLFNGLALGALFLVLMWALLGAIYYFGNQQQTQNAEDRLKMLAQAGAAMVDGAAHETFRTAAQTGSADYQRAIARLVDFHNRVPEIYWLYTMRVTDGKLHFVLDTAQSPRLRYERDASLVSSIEDPVTDYSPVSEPEMLPRIMAGEAHVNRHPYVYGSLLLRTAQAPVFDADGKVVAMLGADLEIDTFMLQQRRFGLLVLGAALASLLIAVAIAAVTMRLDGRMRTVMRRLEREGIMDALTGLHNRAYFKRSLRAQIAAARRSGHTLTLLMFDVDHFKKINDAFGHAAGDTVLRSIGAQSLLSIREGEICCRIGGEEFALLLPGAGIEAARVAFERLSAAIREPLRLSGELQITTISGGIAQLNDDANAIDSLPQRADKALYEAKRGGRDRVVVAD